MTHRAPLKLLATIACLVSTASADVIHVPDDYPTIQQAIDAAVDGDEVIVSPGLYFENIDFLGKDLTVRSADPNDPKVVQTTIIDGLSSGTVVTLTGGVIQGFTLRNGFAEFGGGVNALIDAEIRDNIIITNTAMFSGGGVYADGDVVIDNNLIVENVAENNSGGGIFASTRTIITRNTVIGNFAGAGGGIRALHNSNVRQNVIAGNAANRGGGVYLTHNVTAESNVLSANDAGTEGGGIYAGDHFGVIASNTLVGNTSGSTGSGLFVDRGVVSSNIIAFSPSTTVALGGGSEADVDYNCVFGNNGAAGATGDNDVLADPQFLPAPTGLWTDSGVFDEQTFTTILTDELASFVDGSLIGQLVNPDITQSMQFAIISNTQTTLTVVGNAAGLGQVGYTYQISIDFHLSKASPCVGAGDPTQTGEFYAGSDVEGEARIQDCGIDIGADEVTGVPTTVLNIVSTMTAAIIDVSIADCNRLTSGEGSFNLFYLDAPLVILTAEDRYAGLPFRWVINGKERPFGVFTAIVDLTDHVTALAEYFPVVNISRDTFFTGVQDAIVDFATADGDEIVVFPSVYVENIDFLDKILLVRSIDPLDEEIVASTVIDGNMEDTVVTLAAGEISGFTLRNGSNGSGGGVLAFGSAIVSHNIIAENTATGVEAQNSVVVRNNTIINNFGSADGSGVTGRHNVIITENTIVGNTTLNDGGGVKARENCLVIDNIITGNQARSGGGVFAEDDSIVTGNIISDNTATNRGGGVYALDDSTIQGNHILNNESLDGENGGGGIYAFHRVLIADNAIISNTSFGPGGGLHLGFGADAIGNTIVGNTAMTTGGGIFAFDLIEHFLLLHNIVAFNAGSYGIYSQEMIEIDYNCVFGNGFGGYGGLAAPGPHDIDVDPWLGDDLIHLLPDSPCVNAGDPAFVGFEGQTDIDGDPRVLDGRVDIGADESRLGDLNGNGSIGAADLLILLASWGTCPDLPETCPADLNLDGNVGASDLLILLTNWG